MPQGPTKMQTAQRLNSTPRGGALHQTKVPTVYVPDVPSSFSKNPLNVSLWQFLCVTLCSLWLAFDLPASKQTLNHRAHGVTHRGKPQAAGYIPRTFTKSATSPK